MSKTIAEKLIGKRGIRFFGDVHGHYAEFKALADEARRDGWFMHSLGDIIDKGPESPACMALACDLHEEGILEVTAGNHDEKFIRFMQGNPVKLRRRGLASTVSQLAQHPDGKLIANRFFDMMAGARLWTRYGNILAVHGAFHERMLSIEGPTMVDRQCPGEVRARALYGEVNENRDENDLDPPKRFFNWVSDIPAGIVVLLGHTVVSLEEITERRNDRGGRAIHLDTGLEKGGKLSYIDAPMEVVLGLAPVPFGPYAPSPERQITGSLILETAECAA